MSKVIPFIVLSITVTLIIGFGTADTSIPAVNETQGLTMTINIDVDGTLREEKTISWDISTAPLDGGLSTPGPLITEFDGIYWIIRGNPVFDLFPGVSSGDVRYYTAYEEDTTSILGNTDYTNQASLETGNQDAGLSNLEFSREILFASETGGSLDSSETMILDGAGQFNFADDVPTICPFISADGGFVPAFCNRVEMGSDVLISTGSLSTNAEDRFVSLNSDTPVSMDYIIRLTGTDGPADGSVAAHMYMLTREGRVSVLLEVPWADEESMGTNYFMTSDLASEVRFDEDSSAHGEVSLFEKIMHYESGLDR